MKRTVRLDRRASPALLAELQPGGALASLVRLCHDQPDLLDLDLDRSRSGGRATVALVAAGLRLLAVDERSGLFRVRVLAEGIPGLAPEWVGWMTRRRLAVIWPDVRRWLGPVLASDRLAPALLDEGGRVLAALGAPTAEGAAVVRVLAHDVRPAYPDPASRAQLMGPVTRAIRRSLRDGRVGAGDPAWWPRPKVVARHLEDRSAATGMVAVDGSGRLLVVCAASDREGAVEAPARARHAAAELAIAVGLDPRAAARLDSLLAQRTGLGLVAPAPAGISARAGVVPVVVVPARLATAKTLARVSRVAAALSARRPVGPRTDAVEVWVVERNGMVVEVLRPEGPALGAPPAPPGSFVDRARAAAVAWKRTTAGLPDDARGPGPFRGRGPDLPFCLPVDRAEHNLLPEAREAALARMRAGKVPWHQGIDDGPGNHLLSSQVQALNALVPLRADPDGLRAVLAPALPIARVLAFGADSSGDHVAFGWDPAACGRADVAVRYVTPQGDVEIAVLLWRYAEVLPPRGVGPGPRPAERERLQGVHADPDGPFRSDGPALADLLVPPHLDLLRLQCLAWAAESRALLGAKRVRAVLAAPRANRELWLGPTGEDVAAGWTRLLRRPDRFARLDTATLVAPGAATVDEFRHRYGHLALGSEALPAEDASEARVVAELRLLSATGAVRQVLGDRGPLAEQVAGLDATSAAQLPAGELEELTVRLEELAALAARLSLPAPRRGPA